MLLICRQIELQQEREAAELCDVWNELRQKLLSMFNAVDTQTAVEFSVGDSATADAVNSLTDDSIHQLIERLDIIHSSR